ncbi:putative phage-like protein YoqJ [Weissella uvarum]|uniref:SLOG family protein n=1 Tax=Weissella uvarum TaxID=1479233 RepID=UPI00195FBB34|nr:SLOG family protein [Weissella uvarum]MBM7617454.1 putative phage-like protein YoqJ [Weissella uvarum]MCM0595661.1 DUF1273 family protein [Weissella uvarum]
MERVWITGFTQYDLGIFSQKDPKVRVIKYALNRQAKQLLSDIDDEFWVLTGGQSGIEQWAIETTLTLQAEYPNLKVALMTPYAHFGSNWKQERQDELHQRMQQVDFAGSVSKADYQNPRQMMNYQQFMLNHTDQALIYFDSIAEQAKTHYAHQAIQHYQQQHPDYIERMIDFDRLQDYADEYAEQLND